MTAPCTVNDALVSRLEWARRASICERESTFSSYNIL
jgi:hypothetical protein